MGMRINNVNFIEIPGGAPGSEQRLEQIAQKIEIQIITIISQSNDDNLNVVTP